MVLCGIVFLMSGIGCVWICRRLGRKGKTEDRIAHELSLCKNMLLVTAASALLGFVLGISEWQAGAGAAEGRLERRENGAGSYEESLIFYVDGEKEGTDYSVEVQEQRLTEEEERL